MSTTSMFVLLSMFVAASAQISLTTCSRDVDCRTYDDTAATCSSNTCSCTAPDTTDFCSGNSTGTTGVSYVFSFNFECDKFFSSDSLISTLRLSIEQTVSLGEITYDITFSCGSVELVVTGDFPVASVATIGAELQTSVETAIVDTELENTLTASGASVDAGTTTTCSVTSPSATAVYVAATNTCTVTTCVSGYELQTNAPDYVATCVEVEVDSDDDLSDGAIAAIVMGSVGVCALIVAAVFIVVSKKPAGEQKETETVANEPFDVEV